jgi:putative ABC transport system permease protein
MRRLIDLYRLALRVLPPDTRVRHGEQMAVVFSDQLREARHQHGIGAVATTVAREFAALVRFGLAERRRPVPRPRPDHLSAPPPDLDRRTSMLTALSQDLRYAARLLRRSPGFAAVCIATVALAIGANTAIFSVVHGVMLRALPFAEPERIVVLGHYTNGGSELDSTTPGNLHDWMAGATAFAAIAGFAPTERIVDVDGGAERIRGGLVTGGLFEVLGRQPALGRPLTAADDDPAAPPVVALSAALARRLFGPGGGLGASLTINRVPHTVVGVMPPDFAFFDFDYQYWVPARWDAAFRANRDQYFLAGLARLKPGVSIEQADVQLNTVMDAIRRNHPQYTQNAVAAVVPVTDVLLDGVERRLVLLMGAAGFVLLIACANLANLLLARASTRRGEMAVRHALGANHGRLVRQMLAESLLLAAVGGLAGLAAGAALLRVLIANLPADLPRLAGIELDLTVAAFAAVVSLGAGLLFGVVPAIHLSGRAPMPVLREGTRATGRTGVMRTTLVASQLALALMLLVGAGLLGRSFVALLQVPPGFAADRLLTFTASVPTATYRTRVERASFFERAASAIEKLPGVTVVTLTTTLPVAGRGNGAWFNIVDRPWPADTTPPGVPNRVVRANYFQALGIPLLRGRGFTDRDGLDGVRAVVVSESVARRFFPDVDPLGQRIYMGAPDNRVVPDAEIVGVAADVKQTGLDEERPEAVYAPHALVPVISDFTFAVRTSGDPAALAPAVREVMRRLDPGVPLIRVRTMHDILGRATAPARSSMVLVGVFAGVALALALIGVFGVLSYTVTQQTAEFGIRMALGASARRVHFLVLGRGMVPVAAGIAIGVAGAIALRSFMGTLLFGVAPTDPATLVAVATLLLVTAAAAAYLPARRATRVDPLRVLRHE